MAASTAAGDGTVVGAVAGDWDEAAESARLPFGSDFAPSPPALDFIITTPTATTAATPTAPANKVPREARPRRALRRRPCAGPAVRLTHSRHRARAPALAVATLHSAPHAGHCSRLMLFLE